MLQLLPFGVLYKIFNYVPDAEQNRCRLVSQKWNCLLLRVVVEKTRYILRGIKHLSFAYKNNEVIMGISKQAGRLETSLNHKKKYDEINLIKNEVKWSLLRLLAMIDENHRNKFYREFNIFSIMPRFDRGYFERFARRKDSSLTLYDVSYCAICWREFDIAKRLIKEYSDGDLIHKSGEDLIFDRSFLWSSVVGTLAAGIIDYRSLDDCHFFAFFYYLTLQKNEGKDIKIGVRIVARMLEFKFFNQFLMREQQNRAPCQY